MSDIPTFFSFCRWALNQGSSLGHMLDKPPPSERCLACSWLLIYSISHVPSWFPHRVLLSPRGPSVSNLYYNKKDLLSTCPLVICKSWLGQPLGPFSSVE